MGIKKLFTFLYNNDLYKIYPYMNDLIKDKNLDKNKMLVGIDGNLYCYKYSHSYDNMLLGFYNQIIKFLSNGIYPFYIFDGGTLIEKTYTNIHRNNKKNINKNKLNKIDEDLKNGIIPHDEGSIILRKKLVKNSIKITSIEINKIVELLDILNIPYLFSKGEGEYLAVLLNNYKIIDMFLSDDTDPIPSGINYMIKFHFNNVMYLDILDIHNKLELTKEQLCDFSILLGSDYASFMHGLNPDELYKLIKKHNNIETILDETNIKISNQEIDNENKLSIINLVTKLRNIYMNSPENEKKLFINPNSIITNYNIISNNTSNLDNINLLSNTVLEFLDSFNTIMSYDINNANNIDHIIRQSNDLKGNIIKYIKKKKFNIKNIINYIKENINDITTEELSNIKISFTYLNTFN